MNTSLGNEIDRLTAINAELVAALRAALPYVPHDDVLTVLAVIAKATSPTRPVLAPVSPARAMRE